MMFISYLAFNSKITIHIKRKKIALRIKRKKFNIEKTHKSTNMIQK